jgi:hypothetical protein
MTYKIIKPYTSYYYRPIVLPVGTKLEWFEHNKCYVSEAINNVCVPVQKWAVESWHDYFEKVDEPEKVVIQNMKS